MQTKDPIRQSLQDEEYDLCLALQKEAARVRQKGHEAEAVELERQANKWKVSGDRPHTE